jgi:hypothetical protein
MAGSCKQSNPWSDHKEIKDCRLSKGEKIYRNKAVHKRN